MAKKIQTQKASATPKARNTVSRLIILLVTLMSLRSSASKFMDFAEARGDSVRDQSNHITGFRAFTCAARNDLHILIRCRELIL